MGDEEGWWFAVEEGQQNEAPFSPGCVSSCRSLEPLLVLSAHHSDSGLRVSPVLRLLLPPRRVPLVEELLLLSPIKKGERRTTTRHKSMVMMAASITFQTSTTLNHP